MAATPMAMPSADSAGPQLAGAQPDAGQPRPGRRAAAGPGGAGRLRRCAGHGGSRRGGPRRPAGPVSATMRPSSISMRRGIRAAMPRVVGDTTMVAPRGVELLEQRQDGRAGGLVEVAGGLVGQHDGRPADQGPGDGHPLPLPARQLGRPGAGLCAQARPGRRASAAALPALGQADPGVEQAVGHVVEHASGARPGRTAGTRTRSASPAAPPARGRPARPRPGRSPAPCRWWAGPGCPSGAAAWSCPTPTGRRSRPAPRRHA